MQRTRRIIHHRARLCGAAAGITLASLLAMPLQAQSLADARVTAGSASVAGLGTASVVVTQSSDKAVIDWRSFSVDKGTSVRFDQPGTSAIALNRVTGTDVSQINGSLTGNGQVWILNPNGVLIGASGSVSAPGFLATTHAIGNADFLAGNYAFDGSAATGSVVNQGRIVTDGGYAVLAGTRVANTGYVQANLGQVVLGAGKAFTLDLVGDKLLSFAVTQPVDIAAVDNSGSLTARGGRVVLTARAAADVIGSVINTTGLIDATAVSNQGGEIVLDGGTAGLVYAAGTLDASGKAAGQTGGAVKLFGDTVVVGAGGLLDASGDAGGGTINVGGGWQGTIIDGHASAVRAGVAASATLDASAIATGNGGTISLWSDTGNTASQTLAYGTFMARGGLTGGNGGRIETSGHYLDTAGATGSAAARSVTGAAGLWLLDPYDVEIVAAGSAGGTTDLFANGLSGWSVSNYNASDSAAVVTSFAANGTVYVSPVAAGNQFVVLTAQADGTYNYSLISKSLTATAGQQLTFYTNFVPGTSTSGSPSGFAYAVDNQTNATFQANYSTSTNGWITNTATLSGGSYAVEAYSFSNNSTGGFPKLAVAISVGSGTGNGSFAATGFGQTWTPTGTGSKIDVSQITGFLNAGTNVQVTTTGAGADAGNITVSAAIAKTGTAAATLQLDASNAIFVNQAISASAGTLNVTLNAGAGGIQLNNVVNTNGGTLTLNATGGTTQSAAFATGALSLANSGSYTLTNAGNALSTLSGTAGSVNLVNSTAATINGFTVGTGLSLTNAGAITVGQTIGATNTAAPITVALTATAGNIALNAAVNTSGGTLSLGTSGAASQTTALSTGTLSLGGSGSVALTNAGNAFTTLSGSTGSASLVDSVATTVSGLSTTGTLSLTDSAAITLAGIDSFGGATTFATPAGITLASGAQIATAGLLAIEAGTNFTNNAGANAIATSGGGRWLVYSQAPTSNVFGGLASGNAAVWGATVGSTPPGSAPAGNRYIFAFSPTITVTPTATHKIYGDTLDPASVPITTAGLISAATYGNVFTQDQLTGTPTISTGYGGLSASSYTGTYTLQSIQGTLSAPAGYGFAFGSANLTVDRRALILAAVTDSRIYDRTTTSSAAPIATGLVNGDTIANLTQAFDSANAGNRTLVVNTNYAVSTNGLDANLMPARIDGSFNYTITRQTAAGTITPKALTAALIGTTAKTYDGSLAAALAAGNYQLTGILSGDSVALNNPASGTYADKNVGTGKTVTATGLALTGSAAGNYTVNANASAAIGSITAKTLAASLIGTTTKTYDGTTAAALAAANYQLAGMVSGDDVTLNNPVTGTYADKNVGTGKSVTASGLALAGNDAGNYTVNASASANIGSITTAMLTASLIGATTKTYDGTTTAALAAGNYQLTGAVSGDMVTLSGPATGSYADKNAGAAKAVTAAGLALAGNDAGNYTVNANATGNIGTITPAALTAALIGTTAKTYDGSLAAALAAGNYQLTGVISGDIVALNNPTSGTYADKNAGTGKTVTASGLALSGSDAGNYTVNASASAAIGSITAKTLAASLIGATAKTYDGTTTAALAAANYQLAGVVQSDDVALNNPVGGSYADKNVGTGKTVTATGLALSGGDAGNYIVNGSTSAAIGSITAKTLAASLIGATTKIYDGTTTAVLAAGNYQLAGVVSGDNVALNNPTNGSYADKNVGTGKTVATTGLALSGGDAGNYTVNASTSAAIGSIAAKTLVASLVGTTTKTYDGSTAATLTSGNYQLSGAIAGDSVTLNGPATGSYADKNVGTAKMVATTGIALSGGDAGNYTVNTGASAAIGSIAAKALGISLVGDVSRLANGSNSATLTPDNFALSGFVGGESAQVTQTSGQYDSASAGTSIIVSTTLASGDFAAGSNTLLSNYVLPVGALSGRVGTITPQVIVAIAAQPIVPQVTATVTPVSTAAATPTAAPADASAAPAPASSAAVEVAAIAVASVPVTPPSPVAATKAPTPADSADVGDPILAAASAAPSDKPAPQSGRQTSVNTPIAGGLLAEQRPLPPHTGQVAGVDDAFSGSGAGL